MAAQLSPPRVTKRKLDDAIQSLDDAVAREEPADRPSKRPNMASRSLYSTLLKYGIKIQPKEGTSNRNPALDKLPKNTPHLSAILSRAAAKTRSVLHTPAPLPTSGNADYRPSSLPAFLNRLSTFKLSSYANKPPCIDAVAASKCGWSNEGKDRLVCDLCSASWVVGGRDGLSREAVNTLVEKQRVSLVENHKLGCPWRTRQCDDTIYRIPLQSPTAMAKEVRSNAMLLTPLMRTVQVKHSLLPEQIASVMAIMDCVAPTKETLRESSPQPGSISAPPSPTSSSASRMGPSETAVITSLYGWSLAPPMPPPSSKPSRSSFSLSRASSVLSRQQSPFRSSTPTRASSVSHSESSPAPRPSISRPRPLSSASFVERTKRDAGLLSCNLCQRRVGLWSFTAQGQSPDVETGDISISARSGTVNSTTLKELDLLREHRSYCPYIAASTTVPTLPSPRSTTFSEPMAGWKAVLTVVMRHGMGRRHSLKLPKNCVGQEEAENDPHGVDSMIEGVKAHGGKELLKYVRDLLS